MASHLPAGRLAHCNGTRAIKTTLILKLIKSYKMTINTALRSGRSTTLTLTAEVKTTPPATQERTEKHSPDMEDLPPSPRRNAQILTSELRLGKEGQFPEARTRPRARSECSSARTRWVPARRSVFLPKRVKELRQGPKGERLVRTAHHHQVSQPQFLRPCGRCTADLPNRKTASFLNLTFRP